MKDWDEKWRGKISERAEQYVNGRYWAIAKMFMISAMTVVCDLIETKLILSDLTGTPFDRFILQLNKPNAYEYA